MPKTNSRILAIDPGTKWMGVAVLEGQQLIYHGVEVIHRGASPHETLRRARKAVLRLMDDFGPGTIAVEKTFFARNRNVALMNVLVDEIRALARRQRLNLVAFAPSTVKKFTCGNGRASKDDVARVMVARFPELKVFLTQDRAWKERFHQNMFDAVALGVMAAKNA